MDYETLKHFYAKTVGDCLVEVLESLDRETILSLAESRAAELISEIKDILNDPALDDPECFQRIEAIVEAFSRYGIDTTRHDWG